MTTVCYDVPHTLQKEKELLEAKCNLLIEAFNQLCNEEKKRLRGEKIKALAAREFEYSVKAIDNEWYVLYKVAKNPVEGAEDNEQWSIPFKIVNNVMVHAQHAYKQRSFSAATKMLPANGELAGNNFSYDKLVGW